MNVCLSGLDVHGIQAYLCASGKLKEIVGASHLVDSFTGEAPVRVLQEMKLAWLEVPGTDDRWFCVLRSAGGVVRLLLPNRQLGVQWARRLTAEILEKAPGMRVDVAHCEFDWEKASLEDAIADLVCQLDRKRNRPRVGAEVPGLPFSAICKLTGDPAAGYSDQPNERLSIACLKKRAAADDANRDLRSRFMRRLLNDDSLRRSLQESGVPIENLRPALNFEELAAPGDRQIAQSYMAVIRFDGNGLGQIVQTLLEKQKTNPERLSHYAAFCEKLNQATEAALAEAASNQLKVLLHAATANRKKRPPFQCRDEVVLLPMRPLVMGGDDLTVVLRGNLGLRFAATFLRAFECHTQKLVGQRISAAAGVALVKINSPFLRAYELADSLLRGAKQKSRKVSCLDFQVVHGDSFTDVERLRRSFYVSADRISADAEPNLTKRPLAVNDADRFFARVAALRDRLPRHHLKRAVDFCRLDTAKAKEAYEDVYENLCRGLGGRHGAERMTSKEFQDLYPESFFDPENKTDLLDCVEAFNFV